MRMIIACGISLAVGIIFGFIVLAVLHADSISSEYERGREEGYAAGIDDAIRSMEEEKKEKEKENGNR